MRSGFLLLVDERRVAWLEVWGEEGEGTCEVLVIGDGGGGGERMISGKWVEGEWVCHRSLLG